MLDTDKYYTIANPQIAEIKIKASKFIANAIPVHNKKNAIQKLSEIRTKYFNATHNCFAYQLWKGNEFRSSDDGEPSGSAGKPISLAIKKYDINDLIIIVTRYFGGTKLGVGGLIRAYSESAEAVLDLCEKKIINMTNSVKITCRYEEISLVKRLLDEYATSYTENYTNIIEIIADIPSSKTKQFIDTIISITNTKANAETVSTPTFYF